jgi:hypothetical protein
MPKIQESKQNRLGLSKLEFGAYLGFGISNAMRLALCVILFKEGAVHVRREISF